MVRTSHIGKQAENAVAEVLINRGHNIICQNWRNPRCEIDIISHSDGIIFFTEVKYRASFAQGEGFEYVTAAKRRQMEFAAQVWLSENDWPRDAALQAASVSGLNYDQIDIVEL